MILKEIKFNQNIEIQQFPFTLPILRDFKPFSFKKPITILVGENGRGKSTFLEGMAAADLSVAGGVEMSQDKEMGFAQILANAFTLSRVQKTKKLHSIKGTNFLNKHSM
ncbi:AAA family ATPase [Bacillus sp. FJAT-49711]|uniref:AAA family ATPase n=1 Tax=Bacillus sp. FJAT-49711 TaxID=2833585 RepID=UPI001BC9EAF7|nr:AAA family ATPase [Bacillus sp. FJAT-49711]MBS4217172.1 AAA family ATPase [Bacillus sp. FJAT-49711]